MNVIQTLGMLQQIQKNPMSILSQRFNIPDGVNVKDPNEIINHLVTSGQVRQSEIDKIRNSFGPYMN